MIFVTVGTHEQQFNRLVRCMDELKRDGLIVEDVIIQTGFSDYEPRYCEWKRLFSYAEMQKLISEARIVITHGGPSSFIAPLQLGKIPIVVPRTRDFNEHVNDHQLVFCREVFERQGNILLIEDIETLDSTINEYEKIVSRMKKEQSSNNRKFNEEFQNIVNSLF